MVSRFFAHSAPSTFIRSIGLNSITRRNFPTLPVSLYARQMRWKSGEGKMQPDTFKINPDYQISFQTIRKDFLY